jgi:hypothetical protein
MSTYKFKTTNIKGKDYVEVNQRVIALRALPEFKGHSIETELLHLDTDSCVVRATIKNAQGQVVSQGMAQEDKSSSRINQTSYVENCETSAVGRALGFLGIGIETSIATADEVGMAISKQDAPAERTAVKLDTPKPVLDDDTVAKMLKAIEAGKGDAVFARLVSYEEQSNPEGFAKVQEALGK